MRTPSVAKIVEIGLNYPEIGTKEIASLFGCSLAHASKLKKEVQAEMVKRNASTWNPQYINTVIAFEVWGIDLTHAERAFSKLKRMGLLPEVEATPCD